MPAVGGPGASPVQGTHHAAYHDLMELLSQDQDFSPELGSSPSFGSRCDAKPSSKSKQLHNLALGTDLLSEEASLEEQPRFRLRPISTGIPKAAPPIINALHHKAGAEQTAEREAFGSGGIGSESPDARNSPVQFSSAAAVEAVTNCPDEQQNISPTDSNQQYIPVVLKPLSNHTNLGGPTAHRPDSTTLRPQWQHLLQPGKVIQPMDADQRTSHPHKRGNSLLQQGQSHGTASRLMSKSSRSGKRSKSSQALATSWNAVPPSCGSTLHNHIVTEGGQLLVETPP